MPKPPVSPLSDGPVVWHLVTEPKVPFTCDVCGQVIPEDQSLTFTTLPNMYYETPPKGYTPCNELGADPLRAAFKHSVH